MRIKNKIFDTIFSAGAFVVQPTSDKRTMFAGVIHDELFEQIEVGKEKSYWIRFCKKLNK